MDSFSFWTQIVVAIFLMFFGFTLNTSKANIAQVFVWKFIPAVLVVALLLSAFKVI